MGHSPIFALFFNYHAQSGLTCYLLNEMNVTGMESS